jgi:hypothetical protein
MTVRKTTDYERLFPDRNVTATVHKTRSEMVS